MKKIIIILVIGLFSRLPALSQGVVNFDINFGTNPPPNTSGGLVSAARLSTDGTFWTVLYLGSASPDSGFIGQMDGGTFTSEFQFTNQFIETQIGEYGYIGSWQLTGTQVQDVLAGQWYAEVIYSDASYIGQITPVPEPSSITLSLVGLVVIFSCLYRRVVRPNPLIDCEF